MRSFVISDDEYFDPTATVQVPFPGNEAIRSAKCLHSYSHAVCCHLPITLGFPSNENGRDDVTSVMSPSNLKKEENIM
jgi:hypothetical protein